MPVLAARAAAGVHASIVWQASDVTLMAQLVDAIDGPAAREEWARWSSEHHGHAEFALGRGLELDLETPMDGLTSALGLVSKAVQRASAAKPTHVSELAMPVIRALPRGERGGALGLSSKLPAPHPWSWHAAALARPEDFAAVERAFATLEASSTGLGHASPAAGWARQFQLPDVSVQDWGASGPSVLRWIPPAEASPGATAQDRATWSVRCALLARSSAGWTYVPASVDSLGCREPAYLYASGDVAGCKRSIDLLRAALELRAEPKLVLAVREERARFARAQMDQETFRLHALHGGDLAGFESDLAALQHLGSTGSEEWPSARGACWSVVGPAEVWSAHFAGQGRVEVETLRVSNFLPDEPEGEAELQRMWTALGGVERWRELKSLRTLGTIQQGSENSRQGVEQWTDFEGGRFALSQIVGATENVLAATREQAWIIDSANGVDLSPEQANKLRGRQECTLFAVLRRLAQADHGGLIVLMTKDRLQLFASEHELCWLKLDAAGLPLALGYKLDAAAEESLYEFHDWKLDGRLPYPARTVQLDRTATVELQFVDADAKLDPTLWVRGKR
jgi:hypothetical protein